METTLAFTPTAVVAVSTVPTQTRETTLTATDTALPTATVLPATDAPTETVPSVAPTDTPFPTTPPTALAPTALHGDAANGAALFTKLGCKSCHMPPPGARRVAPDLTHILTDAAEFIRRPDYHGTATDVPGYIRESIVLPNIFVVPAYRYLTRDGTSVMPLDFSERTSPAEIDDLVAYVLTLP
jgi:mono/diheme cytochrome c family protein